MARALLRPGDGADGGSGGHDHGSGHGVELRAHSVRVGAGRRRQKNDIRQGIFITKKDYPVMLGSVGQFFAALVFKMHLFLFPE